jgi:hypothetical protein
VRESATGDDNDPVQDDLDHYRRVVARSSRTLIGDEGYPPWLFSKLEAELITEDEWHQANRAHRLVVQRRTG